MRSNVRPILGGLAAGLALATLSGFAGASQAQAQERAKRPNIVMLMTDDTGWNDFGAYSGGGAGGGSGRYSGSGYRGSRATGVESIKGYEKQLAKMASLAS
jgi:hypothetical protein